MWGRRGGGLSDHCLALFLLSEREREVLDTIGHLI